MDSTALRSLWAEPRAAHPPGPSWRDGVVVGVVMLAGLLEGALRHDVTWRPLVTIVTLALAPVLLWRRTHPLTCVVVGFGTATVLGLAGLLGGRGGVGLDTMVFVLLLVHALTRWGSGRQIVTGGAVVLAAAAVSSVAADTGPTDLVGGFAVLAASAAAGAALRFRSESVRRELARVRSLERVGLARELHDIVAHHVSAITVQAQAGRAMAGTRPEAALEALAVIEGEASRTLAEMRTMVGVLRADAPAAYTPAGGVADLVRLRRDDGEPVVAVELAGDVTGLAPQVGAAVHRMAQESLTNALRHARHASRVEIRVLARPGTVRLRVSDDGEGDPARPVTPGFGLLGMSERAQLLGGTLRAGPLPGGGWAVDAELPTQAPR